MKKNIPVTTKEFSKLAAIINASNELNGRKQPTVSSRPARTPAPPTAVALPLTPAKTVTLNKKATNSDAPKDRTSAPQSTTLHQGRKKGKSTQSLALKPGLQATRRPRNNQKHLIKARITPLAQLFSCSASMLTEYLSGLYTRPFTPHTLLHREELTAVLTRYGKPDLIQNVEIVDAIDLPSTRRTSGDDIMLLFEKNLFEQVQQTVVYNRMRVESHFTDGQAVIICSKMADSYARALAARYRQLSDTEYIQASIDRYQLHYLAEKARRHYGGFVLTFLYQLRSLKFSNRQAYILQPDKNLASIDADFPVLTFANRRGEEYTLVFHLVPGLPIKNPSARVSVFSYRSGRGTMLGAIDKSGYILDLQGRMLDKLQQVDSSLLIFCNYMKGSRQLEFFTGVESGKCFVCNRPLTEPLSVRYGIGPVCLLRLGGF